MNNLCKDYDNNNNNNNDDDDDDDDDNNNNNNVGSRWSNGLAHLQQ